MKPALPSSLKEERTHGSELFHFGYYTADASADSFFVAPHWHEEIEIVYFQEDISFSKQIGALSRVDSEAIYFIRSGELHRIFSANPLRRVRSRFLSIPAYVSIQ